MLKITVNNTAILSAIIPTAILNNILILAGAELFLNGTLVKKSQKDFRPPPQIFGLLHQLG